MAKNTITLETAQEWAARWNQYVNDKNNVINLKAFLIPGIDFTQVMAEENVVDVRTYFGIDAQNKEHLMVVGVDQEGNDMIDENLGLFIYDFSEPCPTLCNQKAPFISR